MVSLPVSGPMVHSGVGVGGGGGTSHGLLLGGGKTGSDIIHPQH